MSTEKWDELVDGKTPSCDQLREGWECPACGMKREKDFGVDPCMGVLPGVDFACCGHGGLGNGYIRFNNGIVVRFDFLNKTQRVEDGVHHNIMVFE